VGIGVEGRKGVGDGISVGVGDIEGVRETACDVAVGSGVGVTATAGRGVPVGAALAAGVATDSEGGVAPAKDVVGETAGKAAGEQEANVNANIVVQTKDRTTRNLILPVNRKGQGLSTERPCPRVFEKS